MSSSVGKRQRERQKLERAQYKSERKAARHADAAAPDTHVAQAAPGEESELIDELAALHRAVESGALSLDEFEERRIPVQERLEQLL